MHLDPAPAFFADTLTNWYNRHRRPLPWRETTDPYPIWLSEIILQQTRVAQGLPYFEKFLAAYPTVTDLANAPEDEVLRLWQGLGYYSRARNLHHTAKLIAHAYNGNFPDNYTDLLKLKGIGSYTAAAIASFAFREQVAVLDGNVFRVLARVYGISDDIASHSGKKNFSELANKLIPQDKPDVYNQAIMEFGAIQCTPLQPDCLFCPLQQSCFAFMNGLVHALPVKAKAKAQRPRFFHYFVILSENRVYMRKRPAGDIWTGLYDFYLTETDSSQLNPKELPDTSGLHKMVAAAPVLPPTKIYKHILSHQKIQAQFYIIILDKPLTEAETAAGNLNLYTLAEAEDLPKPILVANYLKDAGLSVTFRQQEKKKNARRN